MFRLNRSSALERDRFRSDDACRARAEHRAKSLTATLCLSFGLLTGCSKPLTAPECETLLLRYVDLLANSDRPDATALERLTFKQQAREKAARDPEFAQCKKTVSRRAFECAMIAPSTDDFERCLM